MPDYTITAETPTELDALRAVLKKRLAANWPSPPDPATVALDPAALDALLLKLEVCRGTVAQLRDLAA